MYKLSNNYFTNGNANAILMLQLYSSARLISREMDMGVPDRSTGIPTIRKHNFWLGLETT